MEQSGDQIPWDLAIVAVVGISVFAGGLYPVQGGMLTGNVYIKPLKADVMRELSVPIPISDDDQVAEVEVKMANSTLSYHYRMESFNWEVSNDFNEDDPLSEKLLKIHKLKSAIQNYDKDWELIQIYTPREHSKYIQVLFRKR